MAILSGIHPVAEALRAGNPMERIVIAQGAGGRACRRSSTWRGAPECPCGSNRAPRSIDWPVPRPTREWLPSARRASMRTWNR